jgi:Tol biopolymer transport system component
MSVTVLVSRDLDGVARGGYPLALSHDASKILFSAPQSHFELNGRSDVAGLYVKDLATGAVTTVTTSVDGFHFADLSPDGRKVVFSSGEANLVPGDTNGVKDVFVKDLQTGAVTLVSTSQAGTQGDGASIQPSFSPDGRKVLFVSNAENLHPGSRALPADVFLKDLATGQVTLVTKVHPNWGGAQGGHQGAQWAQFSADGSTIVYHSTEGLMVPEPVTPRHNVFAYDVASGRTQLLTRNLNGVSSNGQSGFASPSPDGSRVAFMGEGSDLVPNDTNRTSDVFMTDVRTGQITRLSTTSSGGERAELSWEPSFSPNGRWVAFASDSILIKDIETGQLHNITTRYDGAALAGFGARNPIFSGDGTSILYSASNNYLVSPDTTPHGQHLFMWVSATKSTTSDGADSLMGSWLPEVLTGGAGDDTVHGLDGADTLDGDTGQDVVLGGTGADFLRGLADDDTVNGEAGDDTVNGNLGADSVRGGAGADFVFGGQGADYVHGGPDADPHVNGNLGDDTVYGGAGSDTIFGGQGSDTVFGEDGDDLISGDLGDDRLYGGAGADRFVMRSGGGQDWVFDFSAAMGDRIRLATGQAYTVLNQQDQVVVVLADSGGAIGLVGVSFASFSSSWIEFG